MGEENMGVFVYAAVNTVSILTIAKGDQNEKIIDRIVKPDVAVHSTGSVCKSGRLHLPQSSAS